VSEHEDIARRLREEGAATAPPDLVDAVMAEVRAESRRATPRRRRWGPRWRPALGWAAAAATLTAIGFGIAHLPSGTSSSASSSSAGATSAGAKALGPEAAGSASSDANAAQSKAASSHVYTISRSQLGTALQRLQLEGKPITARRKIPTLRVPAYRYQAAVRQLRGLERAYLASPHGHRLLIRLARAGTR
jgi:hypothetical protein